MNLVKTQLMTGFCLRLSPSGSAGVNRVTEGRMTLLSARCVFFFPVPPERSGSRPVKCVSLLQQNLNQSVVFREGGHICGAEAGAFVCFISVGIRDFIFFFFV